MTHEKKILENFDLKNTPSVIDAFRVLDPLFNEVFNNVVAVVAEQFNVPIVLLAFYDKERVIFKNRIGIDTEQIPRAQAFCDLSIQTGLGIIICDTWQDEKYKFHDLVTGEPYVRFFANAPIIVPDGLLLGSLCLLDQVAHPQFSQQDLDKLNIHAERISTLIQNQARDFLA